MVTATVGVIGVLLLLAADRRRQGAALDADLWPWLIAEIEAHVGAAVDAATAAVGVCLHGPPPVASAMRSAVTAHAGDTSPAVLLHALRNRLRDPRVDRLCDTVITGGSTDLARLRMLEEAESDRERAQRRSVMVGTAARWMLLAPLVAVAAGAVADVAAWTIAALAIAGWWAAGRWLRAERRFRVFPSAPEVPA